MAELAPTKVPGEPLFESGEGSWRNYLPWSTKYCPRSTVAARRIFTTAGITGISAPAGMPDEGVLEGDS